MKNLSKGAIFRHHRVGPDFFLGQGLDRFFGSGLLAVVMIENRRTVLRPHVGSLAVQGGGIVHGEEHRQQFREGNDSWIKGDLHHLGMAGLSRADLLVGGIEIAPGKTGFDLIHSLSSSKTASRHQKHPPAEGGDFLVRFGVHGVYPSENPRQKEPWRRGLI